MNINNKMLRVICENVYNVVKNDDDRVHKADFIDNLEKRGILRDDPRITEFINSIKKFHGTVDKETFINCISKNISIIEKAFSDKSIIPNFEEFTEDINNIYNNCLDEKGGNVADYIPQLAKQNPEHFGVSICTIDGQRYHVGDTNVNFCIQSCSKPVTYSLALEEHGKEKVHKHVGREPSGSSFNALKLNDNGLPHNPLINSGAIMSCSLIKPEEEAADRFDYVLNMWKKLAGGKNLGYSNSVYLSERMSADRNFALAYFMNENKAFPKKTNIVEILEFYFQCCSLTLNTDMMSIVAATLANGGVCPLTGERVLKAETVKNVLSMMYSCGMYDYSGEFAFKIGLPAKSGVAGGIFVVIPNIMGVCSFSPRLDGFGNSQRGVRFFTELTNKFNFHLFDNIENNDKKDPRNIKNKNEITTEQVIKFSSVGDLSALKRISIHECDFRKGDYDNRTPLHLAASNGHLNVVKYLIEECDILNINPVDRWNGTPYSDAIREKFDEVAEYLKSMGGSNAKLIKSSIKSDTLP